MLRLCSGLLPTGSGRRPVSDGAARQGERLRHRHGRGDRRPDRCRGRSPSSPVTISSNWATSSSSTPSAGAGYRPRARGPRDVQTDFSIRGVDVRPEPRARRRPPAERQPERPPQRRDPDAARRRGSDRGRLRRRLSRARRRRARRHDQRDQPDAARIRSRERFRRAARLRVDPGVVFRRRPACRLDGRPAGAAAAAGSCSIANSRMGGGALRGDGRTAAWTVDVRHQRRAFGANGFYGTSPSKEWTDQTLAAMRWARAGDSVGRRRPGRLTQSRRSLPLGHQPARIRREPPSHRRRGCDSHPRRDFSGGRRATIGSRPAATGSRRRISAITPTRAGARSASCCCRVGTRSSAQAGLRVDDYSTFGSSVNPSFSVMTQPATALRLRVGVAGVPHPDVHRALLPRSRQSRQRQTSSPRAAGRSTPAPTGRATGGPSPVSPFRRWDENVIDWAKVDASRSLALNERARRDQHRLRSEHLETLEPGPLSRLLGLLRYRRARAQRAVEVRARVCAAPERRFHLAARSASAFGRPSTSTIATASMGSPTPS